MIQTPIHEELNKLKKQPDLKAYCRLLDRAYCLEQEIAELIAIMEFLHDKKKYGCTDFQGFLHRHKPHLTKRLTRPLFSGQETSP